MDRGPRIGVTYPISCFKMTNSKGVGPRLSWALRLGPGLFGELVKVGAANSVKAHKKGSNPSLTTRISHLSTSMVCQICNL